MNEVLPKDWNAKARPKAVVLVSSDDGASDVELGFFGSGWYEVLSRPEIFGSFLVLGLITGFFCGQIFSEFAIFVVSLGVALAVSMLLMMLDDWHRYDEELNTLSENSAAPPQNNQRKFFSYARMFRYDSVFPYRD